MKKKTLFIDNMQKKLILAAIMPPQITTTEKIAKHIVHDPDEFTVDHFITYYLLFITTGHISINA